MTDLLDRVVAAARVVQLESQQRREENARAKLKRWQAFRNQYETVALAVAPLRQLRLEAYKSTADGIVPRHLEVAETEQLPPDAGGDDRVYLVLIYQVSADRGRELVLGWATHWRSWEGDTKIKRTYADDDPMWRGLHDDTQYKTEGVLNKIVDFFRYKVDLAAYGDAPAAPAAARAIDL